MKVTLTYETQVEVVVDTHTLSVDSISVIHQLGSSHLSPDDRADTLG